jgi:hypothetical protein
VKTAINTKKRNGDARMLQLKRQLRNQNITVHQKSNIFDFSYISTNENTLCITNPKPKDVIKAEDIITSKYNILCKQANKDPNGNINYYFIIDNITQKNINGV